ncbi:MAG: RecQ family ATP-dependent DNA helicase [Spirochaetia bacterium]|nr:RecQ family ATP-dependent DNA helicase [Spirochaetia bacterium]
MEYPKESEFRDEINEAALRFFRIRYVYPYQRLVIHNVLCAGGFYGEEGKSEVIRNQIVILPTGAGKSLCFMLPAVMISEPVLMIFPLLSLMSDQERRILDTGLTCAVLRGGQTEEERKSVFSGLKHGKIRYLISNPETLRLPSVSDALSEIRFAHVVVDEAHTVSEWGKTFRSAYLQLRPVLEKLSYDILTAFTATASEEIMADMKPLIFGDSQVNLIYGDPDRVNIHYSVIRTDCKRAALLELIRQAEKPLIVFASSRKRVRDLAVFLRESLPDTQVAFYHAGLTKEEKKDCEKWFFDSNDGILTATCAYGLGVDKQNIRTVIHFDPPPTIEAYLQESGRGGRDRLPARAYLLYSREDRNKEKRISHPLLRQRYRSVLEYAEGRSCRREFLTERLNHRCESCSGCDVCNKAVVSYFFTGCFFSRYRFLARVLNPTEFRRFLFGLPFSSSHEISFVPLFGGKEKNREAVYDFIELLYKKTRSRNAKKFFGIIFVYLRTVCGSVGVRSYRRLQQRLDELRIKRKSGIADSSDRKTG